MSVLGALPLARAPQGWPVVVSATVAMVVLAAVDIVFMAAQGYLVISSPKG